MNDAAPPPLPLDRPVFPQDNIAVVRATMPDGHGGYVLVQNGKSMPIKNGQVATSASDPSRQLMFWNGQWSWVRAH
jgi:hypothetical protein